MMTNVWKSKELGKRTKMRLFNSNVKTVLLYGSETWRTTKSITQKLQAFINKCLRRILGIKWMDMVSNDELRNRSGQQPLAEDLTRREWRWIGHTLRKPTASITRQALIWNPQGKRKRGRPRNTWRRDLEAEARQTGFSWSQLERVAQDRVRWRELVGDLCSRRSDGL